MADNDSSDRRPLEVVGASLKLCLPSHGCDGGVAPARSRAILLLLSILDWCWRLLRRKNSSR
jgi:hypothetical protein